MSKSITQDMAYRQSLMKYGVSRASWKYNKSRSYIYFWKSRWDGRVASLPCQSRHPHNHPNQHTEAELKLIRDSAPPQSQFGHGGTVAPAAAPGLYPPSGESVSGNVQARVIPNGREEKGI